MTARARKEDRRCRHVLLAWALAAHCCALTGCSFIRADVGQPLSVDDKRLAAAASYRDILQLLGPPHRLTAGDSGMVFLYEEIDFIEKQLGINLSYNSVTLLKAVAARGEADRRLLIVSFDREGKIQAYRYEERGDAAARGAALQFIFAVAGVVDGDDLSEPPSAHEWGLALLEADLPKALNRQQNLESGRAGLEQQATPTAVGQHTLELRGR